MPRLLPLLLPALLLGTVPAVAAPPAAVSTDPAHDAAHPARSEVLHIPVGGVAVNGLAYVAAGPGPHPVLLLFHGLPGNEKNLDLAQAVRRAGWTVVTMNYRGSWGSPGTFSFRGNLADARAALAYLREPAVASRLGIDPNRIALAGHSMGGWVAAWTAADDPRLMGVALISAGDMAALGAMPAAKRLQVAHDNRETLAGVTDASLSDQLAALGSGLTFDAAAPHLDRVPLLVLSADDGLGPADEALAAAATRAGNHHVTSVHVATDHSWDDARIRLETEVIDWLSALPGAPR